MGIGIENEKSLHSALKYLYAANGGRLEEKVGGYIVDVVKEEELIEIQTGSFCSIRNKLNNLLISHKVRLVHPISKTKWLVKMNKNGEMQSKRKSPKTGTVYDVFEELVYIPEILLNKNLSLDVLLVETVEKRIEDGKGSYRRKGVSIGDRELVDICESFAFEDICDYYNLGLDGLNSDFTNKDLSERLKIPVSKCRKITYCLNKMGLIEKKGKRNREILYNSLLIPSAKL